MGPYNKTAIKHEAQNEIMLAIANAVLMAEEEPDTNLSVEEMRKQALRVMKIFGISQWPGIN